MNTQPKIQWVKVRVCIDGYEQGKPTWRALINPNRRWNGWLCPHVLSDDVEKMLRYLTRDQAWITWEKVGYDYFITEVEDDNHVTIADCFEHEGKTYYDFGELGWCFAQARIKYETKSSDDLFNEIVCDLDLRRGAPMGRVSTHSDPNLFPEGEKMYDRKVPFIDGCYDKGGAYWGSPSNLRVRFNQSLSFVCFYRA